MEEDEERHKDRATMLPIICSLGVQVLVLANLLMENFDFG